MMLPEIVKYVGVGVVHLGFHVLPLLPSAFMQAKRVLQ